MRYGARSVRAFCASLGADQELPRWAEGLNTHTRGACMRYMQVRMSSPYRRERWKKLPRAFGEDRLVEDDRYKLGVRVEPRCTRPPRAGVVERTHARKHAQCACIASRPSDLGSASARRRSRTRAAPTGRTPQSTGATRAARLHAKAKSSTGPVLRCSPAARECHAAQPNLRA